MLELTVRLVASLAVVVGLMLLLARLVGKRYGARAGAPVQVVHRQQLSRGASVAVITVGARVLVVGTTDQQVSLLTELDPEELVDLDVDVEEGETEGDPEPVGAGTAPVRGLAALPSTTAPRGTHRAEPTTRRPAAAGGALAGSVLSAQTWRQAISAVTGKAS